MFGWKFWHYFPRNRMDVHEISHASHQECMTCE
jgi:hypothetical protein